MNKEIKYKQGGLIMKTTKDQIIEKIEKIGAAAVNSQAEYSKEHEKKLLEQYRNGWHTLDNNGNIYVFNDFYALASFRINELAEKIYINKDISWEDAVDKAFYAYFNYKYVLDKVEKFIDDTKQQAKEIKDKNKED